MQTRKHRFGSRNNARDLSPLFALVAKGFLQQMGLKISGRETRKSFPEKYVNKGPRLPKLITYDRYKISSQNEAK